ncbi:subtilisin-like protease SBT1.2 [Iris pallida]|uniref:Subtilisin-like protease SBT1.2 n=1 Tax=Iris pallida TaxID=29817 RepID=A0AAX6DHH6_IRIPA|nr:subtilisin-like protease SBT1.2 [Iris pallida]
MSFLTPLCPTRRTGIDRSCRRRNTSSASSSRRLPPSGLLYSYRSVSAFAARLTEQELRDVERRPGFVSAYPDRMVPLLTTRTPEFLGLYSDTEQGLWKDSNYGEGTIVGIMDTGIAAGLPSFQDNGLLPPPPARWKGVCEFNASSLCNNKLIGARNFARGLNAMNNHDKITAAAPPSDTEGHGTHAASTAVGMFVDGASVDGQAGGTAVGIAPRAHLSVYRVCAPRGCATSDIMAGIDAAIGDGVDVISLSLGGSSRPYYRDGIATSSFAAVASGIFVSCAGGNSGPKASSLSNEAPWMLTVAASTVDRNVRTTVTLGDGQRFDGESLYQPTDFPPTQLPLVYPGSTFSSAAYCSSGSLSRVNVTGKIVLCDTGNVGRVAKGKAVKNAGGAGMIIANRKVEGYTTLTDPHVLPASVVSYTDGLKIKSYINSTTSDAKASITFKGTVTGSSVLAPVVAYFSSRGPSKADRNILKPDITGPGVNILAAWPFDIGTPAAKFNIISGTSMSTPHLTGVVAVLKAAHPDWSPAAIKSAIMTTASRTTNNGSMIFDQNMNKADFFAIGAGHVDPVAASNPGLVYDLSPADYVPYLCGLNYTDSQVTTIVHKAIKCADYGPADLNYPSFMVFVSHGSSVTVTRTVTNVGAAGSSYSVRITEPVGVSVTVQPDTLSFSQANEKAQFIVTFTSDRSGSSGSSYSEGHLTWVSADGGDISVKSPIMVGINGGGNM